MKQILHAFMFALALSAASLHAATQPNIVHIVADDLGWKDVGFNGGTDIKTPHLDALAEGGVKFSQFCVQPMRTSSIGQSSVALITSMEP